jgi:hypothetical protein
MTFSAKVHDNRIALPPEIRLPDGTDVEIVLPTEHEQALRVVGAVRLPTFKGDGLQPGVDLGDSRSLGSILDSDGRTSQLP